MLTIKVPQSHGPGVTAFEVEQRWDQSWGQRGAFGSVTGDLCLCMSCHPTPMALTTRGEASILREEQ